MNKRQINKIAVLGSGVMGSRIACHFANIGVEVLLLDIAPRELNDKEKAAGLALDHPKVKNRIDRCFRAQLEISQNVSSCTFFFCSFRHILY